MPQIHRTMFQPLNIVLLAEQPCQDSTCSHICGVINATEECFCPIGFELSTLGGSQCIGIAIITYTDFH